MGRNIDPVYIDNLFLLTMTATVSFVLCLPLYIIGMYKLWAQRNHHFIQKRFPEISMTIICSSFITAIIHSATRWLDLTISPIKLPYIASGCTLFVYGLMNVRLSLIYFRCKQTSPAVNERLFAHAAQKAPSNSMNTSDTKYIENMKSDKKKNSQSVRYHWVCKILLMTTIVVSSLIVILDPSFDKIYLIKMGGWGLQVTITVVLIIMIKRSKISEGIGCLRETEIMLCFEILLLFMTPLLFISKQLIIVVMIIFNLAIYVQGLMPLYLPLYYLRNYKVKQIHNTDCLLPEFLNKIENYQLFEEYLKHCWALENLIFYQKVSIIKHIVRQLKTEARTNAGSERSEELGNDDNTFGYMTDVYDEYNKVLDLTHSRHSVKEIEFTDLRSNIFLIYNQIYNEFIPNEALHQINVSANIKKRLDYLLKDEKNIECIASFEDFLTIFDDASVSIFQLLTNLYQYEFKMFVQSCNELK